MSASFPPQNPILAKANLRERFERLAGEWKEQSRYLSNSGQMALRPPYQRIIGMGLPAVPLILEELGREPELWFWALKSITEENPVLRLPRVTPAHGRRVGGLGQRTRC